MPDFGPKPEFATNRENERVVDALRSHLDYLLATWIKPFDVSIASAYFNPDGFGLLAESLERVGHVRLLLGAEPQGGPKQVRDLNPDIPPEGAERSRVRNALAGHTRTIREDRDLLGFTLDSDYSAKRLISWLQSSSVEVRRFEGGFLHGKAFMVTTDDEAVIAGSSNFTYAGLAVNYELNLGHYQPHVVQQVRTWFDDLWEQSRPFDLAAFYAERFEPHSPYVIYLRMLLERYGREIELEAKETTGTVHLTQFQRDGLWRARRVLDRRNGVLIADGVGLGKTYLAGELIRETVQDKRQRVLLVAPAPLRDGPWRHFLLQHQLGVECLSFEELAGDAQLAASGGSARLRFDLDEYEMVVIDEAHGFRNPDTQRAAVLRRLLQGQPPKKLVLLTATPVNNSLWDLYYLLQYFVRNDAAFADSGIRSMRQHFAEAMALEPDDLSPDKLFDVLDAVSVRRTRHFVKHYYPHDSIQIDGLSVPIAFPKPQVLKVTYNLDEVLPGFFERFAHALDCSDGDCEHSAEVADQPVLSLARYVPSHFLREGQIESYELQLAGLLRSALLKRFESSAHAFSLTCERMAANHDGFLDLLDKGYVATGETLAEWLATDSEEFERFEELLRDRLIPLESYHADQLRSAVECDRDLLRAFAQDAQKVTADVDPKLSLLVEELEKIAQQAQKESIGPEDEGDKRKVLIFSYYADTVEWIHQHLEEMTAVEAGLLPYKRRIAAITGEGGDKSEVMFGFAPKSSQAPAGSDEDRYDVVVSTDVLAEGVNLQQARHIINYDLPWNPMRLVQRHGRIDRIGSPHDRVFIRCVFPDVQLNDLLQLEDRLHRKISQAAASVGIEGEVLPGSKVREVTFTETRDEIEALRSEDATLFESGGEVGGAYSGEEYRQELRAGLENPEVERLIRALPWGSGSGVASSGTDRGFVFCARVGNYPTPRYCYVSFDETGQPHTVHDTLACLAHAHATPDTQRVLDESSHQLAYDAWSVARSSLFESWQFATDPRNLQPVVPKTMRDAAAVVREHPPAGYAQDVVDGLVDALEAPYGPRIQRVIRDALRSSTRPREQSEAVTRAAIELGLEPTHPPEPLPVISEDDVHLVCWMAIVPRTVVPPTVVGSDHN